MNTTFAFARVTRKEDETYMLNRLRYLNDRYERTGEPFRETLSDKRPQEDFAKDDDGDGTRRHINAIEIAILSM